MDYRIRLA